MKNRRIALINYISFLFLMGYIWYVTLIKNKISYFDSNSEFELIEQELIKNFTPDVQFIIDPKIPKEFKELFNSSIQKQFNKGMNNLDDQIKFNFTVTDIQIESQNKYATTYVTIQESQTDRFVIQDVATLQAYFDLKVLDQNKITNFVREVKRCLNTLVPNMVIEEAIDSNQLYQQNLLIFDYIALATMDISSQQVKSIINYYKQSILQWMDRLEVDKSQIRINYKLITSPLSLEYLKQVGEGSILLPQEAINNILQEFGSQQSQRANYQDYILSSNILIITDDKFNLIKKVNYCFQSQKENNKDDIYSFLFVEPNSIVNHIRFLASNEEHNQTVANQNPNENKDSNLYLQDQILMHVFELMIRKFQLQEQYDLFETLEFFQAEKSEDLLFQYFKKREQLRSLKKWHKELQYIKYIQDEYDYKITNDNFIQYKNKFQYVKNQLANFSFNQLQNQTYQKDATTSNEFGQLDTFSFEYLLGVYLPILLPFVYPIIIGLIDEIKESKKHKQLKQKIQ